MPLSEAARELLRAVLAERTALVEKATDVVYYGSPDLAGKRARPVTRILVDRVFTCSEAALFREDDGLFHEFIDHVAGLRADEDYHVSTLLTGFRSFRGALEEPIRTLAADPWVAWELLVAVDDVFVRSASRAADLLVERQHAAREARRGAVEREIARVTAELRLTQEALSAVRAELDASSLATLTLEQDARDKEDAIFALADRDPRARDVLSRIPAGPERTEALRQLRSTPAPSVPPLSSSPPTSSTPPSSSAGPLSTALPLLSPLPSSPPLSNGVPRSGGAISNGTPVSGGGPVSSGAPRSGPPRSGGASKSTAPPSEP